MTSLANADYAYLRGVVYRHSRNVLESAHDHLFQTRLSGLLRRHGITNLHELVCLLRSPGNSRLEHVITEAMTINETSFFRDCRTFEALRTEVLPTLIESRLAARRLRVWSAACSTGQEAYSLAMLIREHFPLLSAWEIRIEGTDISADVVERACLGRYHRIEMNRGLPARLLVRYFDRSGEDWVVKPSIASLCRFRQANLCAPLPFQHSFDLVLLRNVMIYLSMEARLSLLAAIRRLTAPDGYLVLGSAEQVPDRSAWTTVLSSGSTYHRPL